tara:strand:+ start:246 stop:827 length:582 start_codon:yes stop_codon:yes gene_type:complete
MANLSYSTADIANGQALDATKVQGKFDDIETYLNSPSASAGIGTSNYSTNHADMALTLNIRDALGDTSSNKRSFRLKTPAGVPEFAPTLLTVSYDNGMVVSASDTITVFVVMKKGTFGSESSVVTLTGTYDNTNAAGTVFSTTAFGSTVITDNQVILFEVYQTSTNTDGGAEPTQGTDTIITLWGQCIHRVKE